MLVSKALHPSDYADMRLGVRSILHTYAECKGAGYHMYIPHEHRFWEYASVLETLHDAYKQDEHFTLLDLGAGHSLVAPSVMRTFPRAGVDETEILEKIIEHRQDISERYGFASIYGDLTKLDEFTTYDVLTCISVLEHVPEWRDGLKEMLAHCKHHFILTFDYNDDAKKNWHSDSERCNKFDKADMLEVVRIVRDAGFQVEVDETWHGSYVFDYTFFRVVGVK